MTAVCALLLSTLSGCFLYPSSPADGASLFRRERCIDCHGPSGLGTGNGPTLDGLASRWTADALADYIADPEAYLANDARLSALADQYDGRMIPFGYLSEGERHALASFVLSIAK